MQVSNPRRNGRQATYLDQRGFPYFFSRKLLTHHLRVAKRSPTFANVGQRHVCPVGSGGDAGV